MDGNNVLQSLGIRRNMAGRKGNFVIEIYFLRAPARCLEESEIIAMEASRTEGRSCNAFVYMWASIIRSYTIMLKEMAVKTKTLYRWLIITRTQEVNCIPQLGECIRLHGALEIMKSAQVDQYTSHRWTCLLLGHGVKASMDGGGGWCKDNILMERFRG